MLDDLDADGGQHDLAVINIPLHDDPNVSGPWSVPTAPSSV